MAMFNIPFFGNSTPAPAPVGGNPQVQAIAQANLEAAKQKRMAEMLDGISYDKRDARSPAEGYSKIFTAVVGGRAHNAADTAEQDQRNAMAAMLEGASPLEQGVFASGDKNMQNTVVQQRLAMERDKAKPNAVVQELTKRKAIADASGYPPGSPEYRDIIANGNANAAATARYANERAAAKPDPAQAEVNKRRAIAAAAGYAPGSPEEQQIIANGRLDNKSKKDSFNKISIGDIEKLKKEGVAANSVRGFADTFKPTYAGDRSEFVGDVKNWAGRTLPGGDGDRAAWWQNYAKYRNEIRHSLFGSALTAGEEKAWNEADINAAMTPDAIRKNLEIQDARLQDALRKKYGAAKVAGYNPEVLGYAYGMTTDELEGKQRAPMSWSGFPAPKKIQGALPPEGAAAAAATESGGTPAQPATAGVPAATIPDIGSLPPAALEGLKAGKGVKIGGKIYRLGEGGTLEEAQ